MSNKKYKIRSKSSGKFIGGNKGWPRYFRFTRRGITWGSRPTKVSLQNELYFANIDPSDLEVVVYELTEVDTQPLV